jgi:MSHA biogenesis protein MshK
MRATETYRILLLASALCMPLTAILAGTPADPTRPSGHPVHGHAVHRPGQLTGWTLTSTLVAPDRRVAVINGQQVSEGEPVDGARVLHIAKLSVVLAADGKRITLHLLPDIVQYQP